MGLVLIMFSLQIQAHVTFEKWYGGSGSDIGMSVAQTSDGGYIIAGHTKSFGAGSYDVYLIKADASGDTTWTKTYGGTDIDYGYSVAQTTDGGYIIAGTIESFGAGNIDVYLIKTDSSGVTIWTKTFGSNGSEYGYSVAQTTDGGYIVAGSAEGDVYLIKTDASGDFLWAKTHGSTETDWGKSVAQTTNGGYIIAGATWSFGAGSQDVYLIKTDSLGNVGVQEKPDQKNETMDPRFSCLPNPFTTVTSVRVVGVNKDTKSNLNIYDASGRLVKSIKLTTSCYQLSADLVPGIYFLKLTAGVYTETNKLIKIR